ncbi:ARMT1-like domain-containing protein [Candidatus Bipolaricaulota bacterium]|nr:ARMT1-like domain-containing protein [Candidatus Bipolaricaulota bacterium]
MCKELSNIDRSQPSARVGQKIHKIVRDKAKISDPYRDQKEESNESASKYLDEFRRRVLNSEDPLKRAARLATAGNAVDFGPKRDFDIEKELECCYEEEFAISHWQEFLSRLRKAKELLYFVDNSGEIIYDALFVELLLKRPELKRLDLVVGAVFLNSDEPFITGGINGRGYLLSADRKVTFTTQVTKRYANSAFFRRRGRGTG